MQSEIIAMLVPQDSLAATMLVRRANGQFNFARIDARVASAARVAAGRNGVSVVNLTDSADMDAAIEEAA
jgi:hypothetical protein